MKKILISTGGSGGHVIPALNLFDHLNTKFNTLIATDKRGQKYINDKKYKFYLLNTPKYKSNFLIPLNVILFLICICKSIFYLKTNKITDLVSTGGYMSLPFCISAKLLGINLYLFEPNMVIGRANRLFINYCKKIICYNYNIVNFPNKFEKKIYLSDPILKKKIYNFNNKKKVPISKKIKLLILGGSQGAEFFDKFIIDLVFKISKTKKISIIQQASNQNKIHLLKNKYNKAGIENKIFSFDENIYNKIADCNLSISRCGASTLAELTYLNIPFIGVPFPFSKDNHQYFNAKDYQKKKCCWLIDQNKMKLNYTIELIKKITNDSKDYNEKILNMNKISYNNSWHKINKKLINLFNEN